MTRHCSYSSKSDSLYLKPHNLIYRSMLPLWLLCVIQAMQISFFTWILSFLTKPIDLELENVFINIVIRYTQRLHILFFFTFFIKTLFLFFEMKFILSKFTVHSRIEFNIKDSIHVFWTQCEAVFRQWIKRLHQLFHKLLVHFISQVHALNRCNTCEFLVTEWCRASTVAPGSYGCSSYIQLPNLHGSTEWSNINKVWSHIL